MRKEHSGDDLVTVNTAGCDSTAGTNFGLSTTLKQQLLTCIILEQSLRGQLWGGRGDVASRYEDA
jgi:hypothetical protein